MSRYAVNLNRLENEANSFEQLAKNLRGYGNAVNQVMLNLNLEGSPKVKLEALLRQTGSQILDEAIHMDSLSGALLHVASIYRRTESEILNMCNASHLKALIDSRTNGGELPWYKKWIQDMHDWLMDMGVIKAKRQKRVEGEPVTERQEHEMNLYMQNEIAKLNKSDRFSEKNWKKASAEDRKAILQDYIGHVAAILGLPAVTINWDYAEAEGGYVTMGYYSSDTDSISINSWVIENGDRNNFSSYNLVSTVVHEMRHYYQHQAVEHPDRYVVSEETIQSWEDSFNNYKGSEDFMREDGMSQKEAYQAYRNQAVETDARWFANQD